ncbi:hypothetical protein [Lysinibacillus fusiformis]|uniref:Uncharacterized protein n=1 Tax=Lysinibacillus fusiformis TaxID=28031 RepID=A0A1H9MYX1_9BACI|nr:hypothetical protein [Lysinibacillus fusiformis]SCY65267.1 hypothetical protein SAMN02787081_03525 [Lysinibacillus fusiformis]SEO05023.1 hypothetical protein SAMN02787103_03328 [Lysinibacillus fusiformis]SER28916.1 hypothetical protein SAMN02787113_03434 [Lysinibacillus fusiformis]
MPEVSVRGNKISSSIASKHVKVRKPNKPQCVPEYIDGQYYGGYWVGDVCFGIEIPPSSPYDELDIDATVEGSIDDGAPTVFVNGKEVAFSGAKTQEQDSYTVPSGWSYVSGGHSSGNGSVSSGSSKVFVSGKQLARKGDSVRTHASSSASIQEGSNNVFAN